MNLYKNKNLLAAFDLYVRQQDTLLHDDAELSPVTLSPEFQWRMQKLLTRRKQGYYHLFGTVARRVASVVIALLIAATTVTISVEALRERVAEFFVEVFEKYTQVIFVDDMPKQTIFEPRKPTYIPDGYKMTEETCTNNFYLLIYTKDNDKQFLFEQFQKKSNTKIDTEGTHYTEITINDSYCIVYQNKGITTILFSDNVYSYRLSGNCPLEELIRIAESIL